MDKYYLISRNKKTNKINVLGEYPSLEDIDCFTTNCYNSRDLSGQLSCPTISNDFFIAKKESKDSLNVMDVLYADSREVKSLMNDNKNINNLIEHFCKKMESNTNFYNMVMKLDNTLYDKCKNYLTNIEEEKIDSYEILRNIVSTFAKYEKVRKDKKKERKRSLERLIVEKKVLSKIDEDKKQLNLFKLCNDKINNERLLTVINLFDHLYDGFLTIEDGEVKVTNNILTAHENLNILDSLLDQRLGYNLVEYLNDKYNAGLDMDEDVKNKYRELALEDKKEIINILVGDPVVLNNAYQWSMIINLNKDKIMGDMYGYQFRK